MSTVETPSSPASPAAASASSQAPAVPQIKPEPPPNQQTPPDGQTFAGKFKSVEELEKGYKELESQFHKTRPTKPGEMRIEAPEVPDDADIPTLIDKAGLDQSELEAHWAEHGKLADEHYAAIRKARPSLSRRDVEFIAEGLAAKASLRAIQMQTVRTECEAVVGGKTQFESLLRQAAMFVPESEQKGINAMLANPSTAKAAVRVLMQMHAEAAGAGKAKPLIGGSAAPSVGGGARSMEDYQSLMAAAARGDKSARSRIMATDAASIAEWSKSK